MKVLAVASLFFSAAVAAAQPYLVKDLNTTAPSAAAPVMPLAATETALFFAGTRVDTGVELWKTDGTAAGTTLFDLVPGRGSSNPHILGRIGETLFFAASDPDHGRELWRTDGTPGGTRLVADVHPGLAGWIADEAIVFHGKLLFVANTELWSSDGTAAGTVRVAAVNPGPNLPITFRQLGDRVVFGSDDGLWITDGTAAGTTRAGTRAGYIARKLAVAGDRVFFEYADNKTNPELWASDLTHEPALVKRMAVYGQPVPMGNRILFFTNDARGTEPWVSDGTEGGTQLLRDIYPGSGSSIGSPRSAVFGGIAYFVAADSSLHQSQLWRTDGTTAGTTLVKEIGRNITSNLSVALGRLWVASDDGSEVALWTSDGTEAGTRRVARLSLSSNVLELHGKAYFQAYAAGRYGLWSSDGTEAGTALFFDLEAQPSSYPQGLVPFGGRLFFRTNESAAWITDGTTAGTHPFPFANSMAPVALRGRLYFLKSALLYGSDGTDEGTALIADLRSSGSIDVKADTLFMATYSGYYVSDGTTAGTVRVQDPPLPDAAVVAGHLLYDALKESVPGQPPRTIKWIQPASYNETRSSVFDLGGVHCFFRSPPGTVELWRSDGSADGTVPVVSFPGALLWRDHIAAAADILYFMLDNELWRSDATAAGTFRLPGPRLPDSLTALDDRLLFTADDENGVRSLWVSDGTERGTHVVKDVTEISSLTAANGALFFSGSDGVHGQELWQSDGTAEGTFPVADLEPGPGSSTPEELAATTNTLYFSARTTATGRELWALPLPWQTISIGDVRTTRSAASATLTVTLGAPAKVAVTADWSRDDGVASGTLFFKAGEMQKQIVVALVPTADLGGDRLLHVRLRNVLGARPMKSLGTVIVEQRLVADLAVTIDGSLITVRNLGPSTAADVVLSTVYYLFGANIDTALHEIAPGASVVRPTGGARALGVTATSGEIDPNSANNSATAQLDYGAFGLSLTMTPGALNAGSRATLTVTYGGNLTGDNEIEFLSSDPSVISLPERITLHGKTPASFDVIAGAPGTTRLVAYGARDLAALDVAVSPAGVSPRWPSHLTFGSPYNDSLYVYVPSRAPGSGAIATGSVTFSEGSRALFAVPLNAAGEAFARNPLLPGPHEVTATYEGDANFLSSSTSKTFIVRIVEIESISGNVRRLDDTNAEIQIEVQGVPGAVPTGTVTVQGYGTVVDQAPLVNGSITATVPLRLLTSPGVTVTYSGDATYSRRSQSIALTPVRERAVR